MRIWSCMNDNGLKQLNEIRSRNIVQSCKAFQGCLNCKKKLLVEKGGDLYICSKCGICNEYKYYYTLHVSTELQRKILDEISRKDN